MSFENCALTLPVKIEEIKKNRTKAKTKLITINNTQNTKWALSTSLNFFETWKVRKEKKSTYTLGTQRRTVLSLEPDAIKWPDGENETDVIASCGEKNIFMIKWITFKKNPVEKPFNHIQVSINWSIRLEKPYLLLTF